MGPHHPTNDFPFKQDGFGHFREPSARLRDRSLTRKALSGVLGLDGRGEFGEEFSSGEGGDEGLGAVHPRRPVRREGVEGRSLGDENWLDEKGEVALGRGDP